MPKPKYSNQRTVKIDRKIREGHIFVSFDKEWMAEACGDLNGGAYKVWCYLLSNQDGYEWAISPADAEKKWGIPTSTFKDGIRELKEKGYIADGYIHQQRTKAKDEIRPLNRIDENRQIRTDTVLSEDENHISNNNNNNNNINNDKDTSSENAGSIPNQPEEEVIATYRSSQLEKIFVFPEGYDWREHTNDDCIWTVPSGKKVKIIFDD